MRVKQVFWFNMNNVKWVLLMVIPFFLTFDILFKMLAQWMMGEPVAAVFQMTYTYSQSFAGSLKGGLLGVSFLLATKNFLIGNQFNVSRKSQFYGLLSALAVISVILTAINQYIYPLILRFFGRVDWQLPMRALFVSDSLNRVYFFLSATLDFISIGVFGLLLYLLVYRYSLIKVLAVSISLMMILGFLMAGGEFLGQLTSRMVAKLIPVVSSLLGNQFFLVALPVINLSVMCGLAWRFNQRVAANK